MLREHRPALPHLKHVAGIVPRTRREAGGRGRQTGPLASSGRSRVGEGGVTAAPPRRAGVPHGTAPVPRATRNPEPPVLLQPGPGNISTAAKRASRRLRQGLRARGLGLTPGESDSKKMKIDTSRWAHDGDGEVRQEETLEPEEWDRDLVLRLPRCETPDKPLQLPR